MKKTILILLLVILGVTAINGFIISSISREISFVLSCLAI